MPAILLFRHPGEDRAPLLSVFVIHRRANKRDSALVVVEGKVHAQNIHLFVACAAAGIRAGMNAKAMAARIFQPSHPICGQLLALQKLEVVRLIESQPPSPQPVPVFGSYSGLVDSQGGHCPRPRP